MIEVLDFFLHTSTIDCRLTPRPLFSCWRLEKRLWFVFYFTVCIPGSQKTVIVVNLNFPWFKGSHSAIKVTYYSYEPEFIRLCFHVSRKVGLKNVLTLIYVSENSYDGHLTNVLTICKPVCWFAEQINWLVSV